MTHRKASATQLEIGRAEASDFAGTAFRGKPSVPMILPRALGGLLDDGKMKRGVPMSNMAKFLNRKLEETESLLSTASEKANDMESRARALAAKMPSREIEKLTWHETNRNRALVLTRDIERLLNELKEARAFWKRAAVEELKCTDLVWDLLLRATVLYAEANVALEEARASMRRALAFMNEHSTAWTRIEHAKRRRDTNERHRDDDGFLAARKPDWSSGSDGDGDKEDDQHGQVYVVTEASKSAPDYLPGAEHWRSVQCAFGSLRCR
jgi:hypothetical protein